jgi:hypothetical protein
MRAEEPDRAGGISKVRRDIVWHSRVEAQCRDAGGGERVAHERPWLAEARAARQVGDPPDRFAVRQMQDALDLRSSDRESDALEH